MSSLPQAWHGMSCPPVKVMPNKDANSSLPTLRRKWNSPQAPEVPKTKLPTFRKNSVPNGCQIQASFRRNRSITALSSSNTTTATQGQLPECSSKPARAKESVVEVSSLRKELTTLKAENSILKAKVRRVDDENNQKCRQIEKLQAEIKHEVMNSKKTKGNESLLTLRQKCQKLETTLREKEQIMKKVICDLKTAQFEDVKDVLQKYQKEFGTNGMGITYTKNNHLLQGQNGNEKTILKPSRTNIKDQPSKTESQKLREIFHKLEIENKNLQIQVKQKDQEIRRLKLQIQRCGSKSSIHGAESTNSVSKSSPANGARRSTPNLRQSPAASRQNSEDHKQSKSSCQKSDNQRRTSISSMSRHQTPAHANASRRDANVLSTPKLPANSLSQQREGKRPVISNMSPKTPNSTFVVRKVESVPKQKQPNKRKSSLDLMQTINPDVESKVQSMRENIAARKIQQGWRIHRERANKEFSEEQEKAAMLIISELRAHRSRKEKLSCLREENSQDWQLSKSEEQNCIESVTTINSELWNPGYSDVQ